MFYLGIDWGKNKCGLAIADSENMIASTYRQVFVTQVFEEVSSFIQKEEVEKIIIGFHGDLKKDRDFNEFLDEIRTRNIPIEFQDERFSTKIAQKNLIDARKKKLDQKDDVESARIILQSWLDNKKKKC